MNNPIVSNPKDYQVVVFHNSTDFAFTPEMGCMYDSRPISGISGAPGVNSGESMTLPYHIGHQLAINLAKIVMTRRAPENPEKDSMGNPMVAAIWDTTKLESLKNSYLTEMYTEDKPVAMSETDKLMAKVEEYKKMVDTLVAGNSVAPATDQVVGYQDKAEVIGELEKRGITHDKRSNKATLEQLLEVPAV